MKGYEKGISPTIKREISGPYYRMLTEQTPTDLYTF